MHQPLKEHGERSFMEFGQSQVDGDTYLVIMDDEKVYEIILRAPTPADRTLKRTKRADDVAQKVIKWIQSGEVFSYPFCERGTPFQQKVYRVTQEIPRGRVTTYKAVAEKIGTRAYRAVGQALGANPLPLLIPCHRVVGSDGGLTGFGGGIDVKRRILEAEGVKFEGKKVRREYILENI